MSRNSKITKRVRFAVENIIISFDEEVQKEQWYSREDYTEWKRSFRQEARSFRHLGYGVLLKRSFEKPPPDVQHHITAFAQLDGDNYLRGIERYLNKQHDTERVGLKQRSIHGLLRHQRKMKSRLSPEDLAEELSFLEQEYSRPARRFARRIGIADEVVMRIGENPQKAQQISRQLLRRTERELTRWNSSDSSAANASYQARRPKRRGSGKHETVEQELLDETSSKDLKQQDSYRSLEHTYDDNSKIIRDCPPSPDCPVEEFILTSERHLMATLHKNVELRYTNKEVIHKA